MKVLLVILISATLISGEVPPPYASRGFRPSPQFQNIQNPSSARLEISRPTSTNVQFIPSKLTIEQLISLTENISHNAKNVLLPSTSYGVPARQVYNFGKIVNTPQQSSSNNNVVLQPSYRPPSSSQVIPQTSYGPPKKQIQAQPQTSYGVPNRLQSNPSNHFQSLPTSPQVTYNAPNRYQQTNPASVQIQASIQTTYDSPAVAVIRQNSAVPQTTYGASNRFPTTVPNEGQTRLAQITYDTLSNTVQEVPRQTVPQTTYDAWNQFQSTVPNREQNPSKAQELPRQAQPHTTYGAPNQFEATATSTGQEPNKVQEVPRQEAPQNTYGAPNTRGLESFDQLQNSQNNGYNSNINQASLSLPVRGPSDFRDTSNNFGQQFGTDPYVNQQYLPAQQEGASFNINNNNNGLRNSETSHQGFDNSGLPHGNVGHPRPNNVNIQPGKNINISSSNNNNGANERPNNNENIDERYLPPSTTARPLYKTPAPSLRPSITPTSTPTPDNNDEDERNTEQPEEEAGFPNVAVSTAVAGDGSYFYLQQPDGRLQRVIYQKSQNLNDKPEEYTANYLFQNIQALPNTVYTPLITLSKR